MKTKAKRRVLRLELTDAEIFAVSAAVHQALNLDPFATREEKERTALHAVLRKVDHSIMEQWGR